MQEDDGEVNVVVLKHIRFQVIPARKFYKVWDSRRTKALVSAGAFCPVLLHLASAGASALLLVGLLAAACGDDQDSSFVHLAMRACVVVGECFAGHQLTSEGRLHCDTMHMMR